MVYMEDDSDHTLYIIEKLQVQSYKVTNTLYIIEKHKVQALYIIEKHNSTVLKFKTLHIIERLKVQSYIKLNGKGHKYTFYLCTADFKTLFVQLSFSQTVLLMSI